MTLEEARAWLQSAPVQRYMQAVDEDADNAITLANRLLPRLSDFPARTGQELRRLVQVLERAMDNFNAAANTVVQGRARDGRAVQAAWRAYLAALIRLEAEAGRLNAYVEQNLAAQAQEYASSVLLFVERRVARQREDARRRLETWQRQLQEARRDVTEAEIQRAINLGLSAISLMLSLFNLPRAVTLAIGAGGLAVSMLLDAALGPGSPDALGGANAALNNLGGLPRSVRPTVGFWTTAVTAMTGALSDSSEVDDARRIAARVAREMQRARRDYAAMLNQMSAQSIILTRARQNWTASANRARAAARAVATSEADHRALTRGLESID